MRAQLYLDNRIRKMLKEPFETFAKTYHERVIPIFSSLEEESQAIADEKYEDLGKYFNPESDDPADYAEMAWEAGLEHYESMSLMQYNMKVKRNRQITLSKNGWDYLTIISCLG